MRTRQFRKHQRRAGVAVFVMICLTMLVGFVALAVDVGYVSTARAEMQAAADAAALAGTTALLTDQRLMGTPELVNVFTAARSAAEDFAGATPVLGSSLDMNLNTSNSMDGDLLIGRLSDPTDRSTPLDVSNPSNFNSVQVRLRHDDTLNGSITMMFAKVLGKDVANVQIMATAMAEDNIIGFRMGDDGGNPELMPLSLRNDSWVNLLMTGANSGNDNYSFDPITGEVYAGADGLPELNLYPGSGQGQLPPGNFGTVDIGSSNNSTADLSRQILYGVNESDLAYYGGELKLGPDGTLLLNGDTGLSAGVKDELEAIKGKPRAIPLFSDVSGPGNNAMFTVIGFAGIRIMNVKLTGPMSKKNVMIQPAIVVDDGGITGESGGSYNIYRPVVLCR